MKTSKTKYNTSNILIQNYKLKTNSAFTLVELIVVIVILAILSTIAFLSFNSYTSSARDSVRLSDLVNIEKGLSLYNIKSSNYPMPDNYITLHNSGSTIGYQGYARGTVLSNIKFSGNGKDPIDNIEYTYTTNLNQTKYELLGFLEDGTNINLSLNSPLNLINQQVNALDYSKRYPFTRGDSLGILLYSGTLEPVQAKLTTTFTGVDIIKTTTNYIAQIDNKNTIPGSGTIFRNTLITLYISDSKFPGEDGIVGNPDDCNKNNIILANGQIWSACNLGATIAFNGTNAGNFNPAVSTTRGGDDNVNGKIYQWGRNKGFSSNDTNIKYGPITFNPNGTDEYNYILSNSTYSYDWINPKIDDLWGGQITDSFTVDNVTDKTLRKGPCPSGWHVPSVKDWQDACNSIKGSTCSNPYEYNTSIKTTLLLPITADHSSDSKNYGDVGDGFYWSSSPHVSMTYYFRLINNTVYLGDALRAAGMAIRCLKDN